MNKLHNPRHFVFWQMSQIGKDYDTLRRVKGYFKGELIRHMALSDDEGDDDDDAFDAYWEKTDFILTLKVMKLT